MELDFGKMGGLLPAIVQDASTGEVLMVAFQNADAWRATKETGYATFYSRTRNKIWMKGETSGNRLKVKEILTDCDLDTVVLRVELEGNSVCHEGYKSCFFRRLEGDDWITVMEKVDAA